MKDATARPWPIRRRARRAICSSCRSWNSQKVKAKPTATGGIPSTYTQVMSGQIDIGWSSPPFGLEDLKAGKINIVAQRQ